jgi:hypothetical protein
MSPGSGIRVFSMQGSEDVLLREVRPRTARAALECEREEEDAGARLPDLLAGRAGTCEGETVREQLDRGPVALRVRHEVAAQHGIVVAEAGGVAAELLERDPLEGGDAVDVPLDLVVERDRALVDESEQDRARDLGRERRHPEGCLGVRGLRLLAEVDRAGGAGPLPRPRRPDARDAAARTAELHRLVEHGVELRGEILAERRVDRLELGRRVDRAAEAAGEADGERGDDGGGGNAPPTPCPPPSRHRSPLAVCPMRL